MGFLIGHRWGHRKYLHHFWMIAITAWDFKAFFVPWLLRFWIVINLCFRLTDKLVIVMSHVIDKANF